MSSRAQRIRKVPVPFIPSPQEEPLRKKGRVEGMKQRVYAEADGTLNANNDALAPDGARLEHLEVEAEAGGQLNVLAPAPEAPAVLLGAQLEVAPAANDNGHYGILNMTSSRNGDEKAFEGYLYHFDQVLKNGVRSYRCRVKQCYGRMHIKVDGSPSIPTKHNHPPDPVKIYVKQELAEMRKRAMKTDENRPVPSSGAAVTKGQQSTVAKSLAKPVPQVSKRAITKPASKCTAALDSHELSASPGQSVPSNNAAATKGQQAKVNAATVQKHAAEAERTEGSGTQAQPSSKKRPYVEILNVEHGPADALPDVTMDRLARDILNAGSKKSKMDESEQDRLIRLFHAAREAHNLDSDRSIRCEKLVEFIVDESYVGHKSQDRQELFEHLLEMCMHGVLLEVIACEDPMKKRVLMSYSKRLRAWAVICDQFPDLQDEFKAQPKAQLPIDVLAEDAFQKINEYLGELKAAMHSMPKVLKEAVVWQLLGSVGHRYEQYDEGVRKRVAEMIRKNVP
ncbi:hypothetical protein AAVH_10013 [Aphelenchoides avenae]|nr:hypothetical protein AAVH_10013 [Aphelenchus avenae]